MSTGDIQTKLKKLLFTGVAINNVLNCSILNTKWINFKLLCQLSRSSSRKNVFGASHLAGIMKENVCYIVQSLLTKKISWILVVENF